MSPRTKLTPAMEQYMHFKRQHPDAILFFRMGDFYEMFFDDAKEAARLLGLTLTARNHGKTSGDVPLAGVPHHAMEGYLAKLIQLGRKVAICEQIEDPKQAKGVVKRDVVQVVSPGTALSDALLDQQRNNFLVGLCPRADCIGLASVDLSTGDFALDEVAANDLADELESLAPAELLIAEGADAKWVQTLQTALPRVAISRVEDYHFAADTAYDTLTDQLRVQTLKGFGCEDMEAAICAGGAAVAYLRDNQRGAVEHVNRLQRKRREDFALIDAAAQRNLELLANLQDGGRTNTLIEILDRTRTPMGARLMRQWIIQPLKKPASIEDRLAAVDELLHQRDQRRALGPSLEQVGDLERLMARICCQRANARDLVGLARSLAVAPAIGQTLSTAQSTLLQELRVKGASRRGRISRRNQRRVGRRAAGVPDRRRPNPRRPSPGRRSTAANRPRRQGLHRPLAGHRTRAHRHCLAQDRLQPSLWLLHRNQQGQPRQSPRRVPSQTDLDQRRALHHARAKGI